jgi:hypothetical protein
MKMRCHNDVKRISVIQTVHLRFLINSVKKIAFGGIIINMLGIRPKVRVFKPGRGRWILKQIKLRSTTSFVRELKLSVPCRKILRQVKYPYRM